MARRGGKEGIDTDAQDAEHISVNECGRGELDGGFSDTIHVGAAWAEFALAGGKTVKLRAGRAHTQRGTSHTQRPFRGAGEGAC